MTSNPEIIESGRAVPSSDAVLRALADERRRRIVDALDDVGKPLSVADLATQLAADVAGVPPADVRPEDRERVYTSLHHRHLPLLVEANVVRVDDDSRTVELAECADVARSILDCLPER